MNDNTKRMIFVYGGTFVIVIFVIWITSFFVGNSIKKKIDENYEQVMLQKNLIKKYKITWDSKIRNRLYAWRIFYEILAEIEDRDIIKEIVNRDYRDDEIGKLINAFVIDLLTSEKFNADFYEWAMIMISADCNRIKSDNTSNEMIETGKAVIYCILKRFRSEKIEQAFKKMQSYY